MVVVYFLWVYFQGIGCIDNNKILEIRDQGFQINPLGMNQPSTYIELVLLLL